MLNMLPTRILPLNFAFFFFTHFPFFLISICIPLPHLTLFSHSPHMQVPLEQRYLTHEWYWEVSNPVETPLSTFLSKEEKLYEYTIPEASLLPVLSDIATRYHLLLSAPCLHHHLLQTPHTKTWRSATDFFSKKYLLISLFLFKTSKSDEKRGWSEGIIVTHD